MLKRDSMVFESLRLLAVISVAVCLIPAARTAGRNRQRSLSVLGENIIQNSDIQIKLMLWKTSLQSCARVPVAILWKIGRRCIAPLTKFGVYWYNYRKREIETTICNPKSIGAKNPHHPRAVGAINTPIAVR